MATKKPIPSSTVIALRDELEYLYLRRQLVEDLILALEVYGLLSQEAKAKGRAAA